MRNTIAINGDSSAGDIRTSIPCVSSVRSRASQEHQKSQTILSESKMVGRCMTAAISKHSASPVIIPSQARKLMDIKKPIK